MENLKIRVENGATIISTGDAYGGPKNKHHRTGIYLQYTSAGTARYRAEIQLNHTKYFLGCYDTLDEAAAIRKIAEKKLEEGMLIEWFEERKKNSIKNKHGKVGVKARKSAKGELIYTSQICVKRKNYYLGNYTVLKDAISAREEAERQLKNGTFIEWWHEWKNKK